MKKYIYLALMIIVCSFVYSVQVHSAQAADCSYLGSYIRVNAVNDSSDVVKLQKFLNSFDGEHLQVNGNFDSATFFAVTRFQQLYSQDILAPWGISYTTGDVYITTRHKINELYCSMKLPYSAQEQAILGNSTVASTATPVSISATVPQSSNTSVSESTATTGAADMSMTQSTPTDTAMADSMASGTDDNTASASSPFGTMIRNVFSSSVTLVILLILLAFVIYAMVTNKNDVPPPADSQKGNPK